MAGADTVEKLEDVIVRSAEQVAGQIRAAKEAISTVIFGQDRVIENTLVTILSGGTAFDRRARPRQDEDSRNVRQDARPRRQAHPVHARSDALGHCRLGGAGREQVRQRSFRFISGPRVRY